MYWTGKAKSEVSTWIILVGVRRSPLSPTLGSWRRRIHQRGRCRRSGRQNYLHPDYARLRSSCESTFYTGMGRVWRGTGRPLLNLGRCQDRRNHLPDDLGDGWPRLGRVCRRITYGWNSDDFNQLRRCIICPMALETHEGLIIADDTIMHEGMDERSYRSELPGGKTNVCTQYYCRPDPARLSGISWAFSTMADAGTPLRVRVLYFGGGGLSSTMKLELERLYKDIQSVLPRCEVQMGLAEFPFVEEVSNFARTSTGPPSASRASRKRKKGFL